MSSAADKQACKVFCGGLSWETSSERLRAYFENFGVVREAFVSYNRNNGRPRGFGFVVFESPDVADKVVASKHTIDRREVECKKAVPKEEPSPGSAGPSGGGDGAPGASSRTRKVFVGGLAPGVDEKVLRGHFEQFGQVDDAVVMYDHDNKRPRGFGFVTFAAEDAVEKAFARGAMQVLLDKQIEIKPAVPRDQMPPAPPTHGRGLPPFYDARGAPGPGFGGGRGAAYGGGSGMGPYGGAGSVGGAYGGAGMMPPGGMAAYGGQAAGHGFGGGRPGAFGLPPTPGGAGLPKAPGSYGGNAYGRDMGGIGRLPGGAGTPPGMRGGGGPTASQQAYMNMATGGSGAFGPPGSAGLTGGPRNPAAGYPGSGAGGSGKLPTGYEQLYSAAGLQNGSGGAGLGGSGSGTGAAPGSMFASPTSTAALYHLTSGLQQAQQQQLGGGPGGVGQPNGSNKLGSAATTFGQLNQLKGTLNALATLGAFPGQNDGGPGGFGGDPSHHASAGSGYGGPDAAAADHYAEAAAAAVAAAAAGGLGVQPDYNAFHDPSAFSASPAPGWSS